MAGRKSDFTLTKLDDLFSTQEARLISKENGSRVEVPMSLYGIDKTYLLKKRQPIRALVETQYTSS